MTIRRIQPLIISNIGNARPRISNLPGDFVRMGTNSLAGPSLNGLPKIPWATAEYFWASINRCFDSSRRFFQKQTISRQHLLSLLYLQSIYLSSLQTSGG